jgi:hypothetical protein
MSANGVGLVSKQPQVPLNYAIWQFQQVSLLSAP